MQHFFAFLKKSVDKNIQPRYNEVDVFDTSPITIREVRNMTNQKLLEKKIANSGKKKGYLAKKCGLSRTGFLNCVKGDALFNTSHIKILCDELNITSLEERESIFFA